MDRYICDIFASEINTIISMVRVRWLKISSLNYSWKCIQNYELRGKKWIVRILYRSYGFCSQSLQVWSTQGWQVWAKPWFYFYKWNWLHRHVIGEKINKWHFFPKHNLSQLGVWGRCKPPSGVRGGAPEANAYWQQSTENCRIIIYLYNYISIQYRCTKQLVFPRSYIPKYNKTKNWA